MRWHKWCATHYCRLQLLHSTCPALFGKSIWMACRLRDDFSQQIHMRRSHDSIVAKRTMAFSQRYFVSNNLLSTKCDPCSRWLFGWQMLAYSTDEIMYFIPIPHFGICWVGFQCLPIFWMHKVNECTAQPYILWKAKTFRQICCGGQNHTIMHWNGTTKALLLQMKKQFKHSYSGWNWMAFI